MKRYLLIIVFFLAFSNAFSETEFRQKLKEKLEGVELRVDFLYEELAVVSKNLDRAIIHNFIGVEYQKSFDFDSALVHHNEALKLLVVEMPKHEETAISLNKLGIVQIYTGNFTEAVKYLKSSVVIFKDGVLKANALNNLAIAHKYLGEVDKAITCYQEALLLFLDFNYFEKAIDVQLNIANLHMNQNNDSIAFEYLKDAERTAKAQSLNEQFYRSKSEQAVILRNKGKLDEAIELHLSCDLFFKSNNLVSLRISNLNNLAIAYGELEEIAKEIEIYNQLITLTHDNQLFNMLSAVKANLGSAYLSQGKTDLAESNLLDALDIAIQLNILDYLPSIYNSLSEVYKAKNEDEKAVYYLEKELHLRDSLLEADRLVALIASEAKLKNEQFKDSLNQAKSDLKKKNDDLNDKGEAISITIYLLSFLVPTLVLILLLYLNKKRKNRNLLNEVTEKKANIRKLNNEIEDKEGIIKSIEKTSKKPYPSNLAALTERETQVLKHLADGLSDQEISDALHLSPATIRTHLRKAYVKIDVKNRAQATQFVLAHHI